jgi:hypothetical protein
MLEGFKSFFPTSHLSIAAFHGASANPASLLTNRHHLFYRFQRASLLWSSPKKNVQRK